MRSLARNRLQALVYVWAIAGLLASVPVVLAGDDAAASDPPPVAWVRARLPSFEEIVEQLGLWAERFPDRLRVEETGRSLEDRPVLLCRISDWTVPGDDKQRIFFSSIHSAEVNVPAQLLWMMRWLLSDDPAAARIRASQEVWITPCMNPDSYVRFRYFNEAGGDFSWRGLRNPERYPVGVAYVNMVDDSGAEAHVGVHSTSAWQQGWMTDSFISGDALLRPSDPHIMDLLLASADEAGFAFVYGEHGKKVRATAVVPGAVSRFHGQLAYVSETTFAYRRTKGVPLRTEIGFHEAFLTTLRRFMEIGNEVWRGERHAGYPAGRLGMVGPLALAAWGESAAERRASRVAWWDRLGDVSLGILYPERVGRVVGVFCSDPALRRRLAAGDGPLEGSWAEWIDRLEAEPIAGLYDLDGLRRAGQDWPAPARLWLQGGRAGEGTREPPKEGIVLRVYLPTARTGSWFVTLDGVTTGAYHVYHNPGTVIEIPIPPEQVKPLHIIGVDYESDRTRKTGFGPEEWEL